MPSLEHCVYGRPASREDAAFERRKRSPRRFLPLRQEIMTQDWAVLWPPQRMGAEIRQAFARPPLMATIQRGAIITPSLATDIETEPIA